MTFHNNSDDGKASAPAAPPTPISEAYTVDYDQVQQLGSETSSQHSAEETLMAKLFASDSYILPPPVLWNLVDLAEAHGWSLVDGELHGSRGLGVRPVHAAQAGR